MSPDLPRSGPSKGAPAEFAPPEGEPARNGRPQEPPDLEAALRAQALDTLNRINMQLAGELDLPALVQAVTDAATQVTGAQFGAFFYNALNEEGEAYRLYTLSGAPLEAFERFPMPRNTEVFAPTFHGEGVVRSDDITQDPRYGHNAPYHGMPEGHLTVRSYLAVPVRSRSGEVHGGLFFGHERPGVFTDEAERLAEGIAAQAAIGIDNARLYEAAQREIAERKETEAALRTNEAWSRHLLLALPEAVYTTDAEGRITLYNERAAELWGRRPELGKDLWCGSWRIFRPDGTPLPHDECPMAVALREARPVPGQEILVERPDGTRAFVIPSPQPLFDEAGTLIGAVNMLQDVTARKQAERDRALLASIVESSVDAIVSKTLDGTITSWNAGAERLFGYTAEEMVGASILRLIPAERHDEEALILARIGRGERVEQFDTVRRTKEGRTIHVSLTVSPVRDAEGRIIGASKLVRDITGRKRAEAALHESELRFRTLADHAPVLIWVSDTENRGTYFNRQWTAFTGRALEQELDFGWTEAVHPDDLGEARATCQRHFDAREAFRMEFRLRRHDGAYRWVHDYGVPRYSAEGVFLGYIGSCFDIHDRKQAEDALQLREEELRLALDAAGMGTWRWDLATNTVESDEADRAVWGFDAERPLTADDYFAQIHPDDVEAVREQVEAALAACDDFRLEFRIRCATRGNTCWIATHARVEGDDGRAVRVVGVNYEITERKESEAALRESEERARLAVEVARLGTWRYDPATDLVHLDPQMRTIWGQPDDETAIPLPVALERVHPEDREAVTAAVEAALDPASDGRYAIEYRIVWPDGTERWVSASGQVQFAGEGRDRAPTGFVGTAVDVTKRKRSEYALADARRRAEEAERQIRSLIDNLPELAWWARPDGHIDFYNRRWYEYTGTTLEEMEGWGWEAVHDPAVLPEVVARWRHALDTGESFEMEFPLRGADGSFRWFLTRIQPIRDRAGRILRWVGVNVDIHDKRRAETQARVLAQTGLLLAQTLDAEAILKHLADIAVPEFADWCAIDLRAADGAIVAAVIAHADSDKVQWGWALREQFPVDPDAPTGTPNVIRTGQAELYSDIPDELIDAAVEDEEQRRIIREIGYSSVIIVPIRIGEEVVGAISYVNTDSGRHFDEADLAAAEEIGRRAGAALETARLHRALQESESRFRAISELTSDFAYAARLTDAGTFEREWVSGAYRYITGYEPGELGSEEPWRELVHPDDLGVGEQRIDTLRRGEAGVLEFRLLAKDGTVHWVRDYARPELDEDGRVVRVVGAVQDITEQKLAEEALRESEARFRKMANAAPAMLWVTDTEGTATFLSQGWYAYTGQTEEEALGFGWIEAVHPEDRDATRDAFLAANARQEAFRIDYRLRRHDGVYRWAIDAGQPRFDDGGEFLGYVGSVIDIHDRKEAEDALRSAHDTFHHLVDTSPFGIYAVDADFRLAQVSTGAQKVFETVRPLLGRDFAEVLRILWPEPFASEAIGHFRHTLETGEPYHVPRTVERREDIGEVEAYDWKIERVMLPDRRYGVVCHFYDLSERMRYEEALRESEARFRQLAEALPQIVYILPAVRTGDAEYLNPQWYAYTGMPPGTRYAESAPDLVHPDDMPAVRAMWETASTTGELVELELRLRRHDGAYRWFLTRLVPVQNAEGRVTRWFGTSTDIHAQKEAEAELAGRVAARTVELERSNRELDQFAYVASHDLKAPLRAIDSLASWIAEDARDQLSDASQEHLDLLQGRVQRMEALLDSLLAYSRVGRHAGLAERVDTADLVRDVVRLLSPPDTATVEVEETLPTLTTYRVPLELVFRNLIGNAFKHGGPAVRVRISAQDEDGFVRFAIADDGPGIAPVYHHRIFGLFQTLHPRDEVEGSGMGLSVVKKAIESLGGTIRVESAEGEGATFVFTWPRAV